MKAFVFDNYKAKFNSINKYLGIASCEFEVIKFKNGEGKIVVKEEVKGEDVIIFSDFTNSTSYSYKNKKRYYSKDEYYVELRRLINALKGSKSISVFLPLIYASRQNNDNLNESNDYLMFIEDLKNLGVKNIITIEAHGEDKKVKSYSLASLFSGFNYDVVVSPDEGGVKRSKEYSKVLKTDNYHFVKSRDLTSLVDGSNPIREYSGENYDFSNKNILIVDDILDSGSTIVNAINGINAAKQVDVFVSYPLFTKGLKEFKKLVKDGKLNKIYISDLIAIDESLLKCEFIEVVETSKYVASIIKEVIK